MNGTIRPYEPDFELLLLELEKQCPQGKAVQLVMDREQFITRSAVFDRYAMLTYWLDGALVSVSACAETEFIHNGERANACFYYDGRTHPAFRNRGLLTSLGLQLVRDFSQPNGLTRAALTAKANNLTMLWMGRQQGGKFLYPFRYLTIPTRQRLILPTDDRLHKPALFSTDLLTRQNELGDFYTGYTETLGVWHLDRVYQLRVMRMAGWLRILKGLAAGLSKRSLPEVGQTLRMRLLTGFQPQYAPELNTILADLARQDIDYLLVATHQNDGLYHWLRPYAIDETPYVFVVDFPLQPTDQLTLDVRCL